MKLRWKITILCGLLLALLVMALSQVMYDRLRDQTYQVHMEALKAELQRVETAFTEQAERKLPGAQTPEQRKVLLRRLFQQQVSGEAYLRLDGALIYGSASELLPTCPMILLLVSATRGMAVPGPTRCAQARCPLTGEMGSTKSTSRKT